MQKQIVKEIRREQKRIDRATARLQRLRRYKEKHNITEALSAAECIAIMNEQPVRQGTKKKSKKTKKTKRKQRKNETFYESREWRSLRYDALKKYGRRCVCCGQQPPDVVLHVDHIKPRSKYPSLELDINNLQILCKDCNLGKSNKDCIDYRHE